MEILFNSLKEVFVQLKGTWQTFSNVWFLVLPVPFYYLFKLLWMDHIQRKYAKSIKWDLLEIIPPKDIEKSPKPMEFIFNGMAGVMKTPSAVEQFIEGMFPVSFTLELVSIQGAVHFFVRTQKIFRNLIEANIYAQYPTAEIIEVADYVDEIPKIIPNKDWDLWGVDFELTKPDPYPIRTYTSFEEDITGTMIDPLS
ncbi:hypothetical protein ACFLY1_00920, partial [Patescibacteria group bacterium]